MKSNPVVTAMIRVTPYENGGRRNPLFSGYRATVFFANHFGSGFDALITLVGIDRLPHGGQAVAELTFLRPDLVRPHLERGMRFSLREGMRVVAEGVVKNVAEK